MSAAQRKAVSVRMRAYWATRRGNAGTAAKSSSPAAAKPRTMSPQGRKRIAEAQRKRWAAIKKARKSVR